jgi:hypothetical protein
MASHLGSGREPDFESPYKPPAGIEDLIADMESGTDYPYQTLVGGMTFRHKRAQPRGLLAFVASQSEFNPNDDIRIQQMVRFIHQHTHPDDAVELMIRLIDDQEFGLDQLSELTRAIARGGTARPTKPSSHWPRRRPRIGVKSARA